jgi:hypothetical protein
MTQPAPNLISVLSSSAGCIGFLRSAGPRGFQAYDPAGQLLGLFEDKQAAIDASLAAKIVQGAVLPENEAKEATVTKVVGFSR